MTARQGDRKQIYKISHKKRQQTFFPSPPTSYEIFACTVDTVLGIYSIKRNLSNYLKHSTILCLRVNSKDFSSFNNESIKRIEKIIKRQIQWLNDRMHPQQQQTGVRTCSPKSCCTTTIGQLWARWTPDITMWHQNKQQEKLSSWIGTREFVHRSHLHHVLSWLGSRDVQAPKVQAKLFEGTKVRISV